MFEFVSGRKIEDYFVDSKQSIVVSMRPEYGRKENGKYVIPPAMLKAMKKEKNLWRRFMKWLSFFPRIFDIHDHFGLVSPKAYSWAGGELSSYKRSQLTYV